MTVQELIDKLQKQDPTHQVRMQVSYYRQYTWTCGDIETVAHYMKEDPGVVWLESPPTGEP